MLSGGEITIIENIKQVIEKTSEIATTLKSIDESLKKIAKYSNPAADETVEALSSTIAKIFKKEGD